MLSEYYFEYKIKHFKVLFQGFLASMTTNANTSDKTSPRPVFEIHEYLAPINNSDFLYRQID